MQIIPLHDEADVDGWRREARALLRAGVPPEQVDWQVRPAAPGGAIGAAGTLFDADAGKYHTANAWRPSAGLFDDAPACIATPATPTRPIDTPRVPPAFIELADAALLHHDPQRFGLLYRLLWRLQQEPALRDDPLDADWMAAIALARPVRHEQHKMRAFVRFHERATPDGPQFVAWFEPRHHIVASQADFFRRRFASMRWAIFTPRASISWDGEQLHHGGPARRADIPLDDDKQALWLAYYASIFNPARLKLQTMTGEMPRRYWHNLPEARLIGPLAMAAAQRTQAMVDRPATTPRRHRPAQALPSIVVASDNPADALTSARATASSCKACAHGLQATQLVWGEGPLQARVMVVGEQPGDHEDLQGRPFVGPAGDLLARALAEAGVDRAGLYLTNAVKHFGFELRGRRRMHKTPGQREILACNGWLQHEIDAVAPDRLVALGATAAQALLGERVAIERERGQWRRRVDGRPVLVTWHPAALLRMPAERQASAWRRWVDDLAQLRGH